MCDPSIYYTGDEYEKKMQDVLEENGIYDFDDVEDEDNSGTYQNSARAMLFSGHYSDEALDMKEGGCCAKCNSTENLTLDHIKPVSKYFNETGYLKTREERDEWYTDTSNLQVLCRSCNSQKGGTKFDWKKVARCILDGHM